MGDPPLPAPTVLSNISNIIPSVPGPVPKDAPPPIGPGSFVPLEAPIIKV